MSTTLPAWATKLAVFDTETTGVNPRNDRIVSATVALIDEQGLAGERYDWLIDPGIDIPETASRIHGITTEQARTGGMQSAKATQQIIERLNDFEQRGYPLVAYNAPFDLTLLAAEAARHSLEWSLTLNRVIDPLVIDKKMDRYRKGLRKLESLCEHYGVRLHLAHDSGEDAIASGRLAQRLAERFATALPQDVEELTGQQKNWFREQAENYENYRRTQRGDTEFTKEKNWPIL